MQKFGMKSTSFERIHIRTLLPEKPNTTLVMTQSRITISPDSDLALLSEAQGGDGFLEQDGSQEARRKYSKYKCVYCRKSKQKVSLVHAPRVGV